MIDVGDIIAGDPASDLSVAWMVLPFGGQAIFWSAYHATGGADGWADHALRARARR